MNELARWGLSSAGWAVFGLLVGYLLGRLSRDLRRLANAAENEGTTPMTQPRRWPRLSGQTVLVVVVVALGVLTVIQGFIASRDTQRLNQCVENYSNQFADALDARTRATNNSQRALDELVSTIGNRLAQPAGGDQAAIQAALNGYQQKRRMATIQRADNPYPAPPRDACQR